MLASFFPGLQAFSGRNRCLAIFRVGPHGHGQKVLNSSWSLKKGALLYFAQVPVFVDVEVERVVERISIKEVPVDKVVIKEVPYIVDKTVTKEVPVYIDREVEKVVPREVPIDKIFIKEVPVEVGVHIDSNIMLSCTHCPSRCKHLNLAM
jgi:hypothetical protein